MPLNILPLHFKRYMERQLMAKSDGWCVWVTGLPGSGKSVVSEALLELLSQKGIHAQLLVQNGVKVVIDATGNLRRYRENARKQIPRFIEAYLECPVEICIEREGERKTYQAPKQIYSKALEGKAPTVPGVGQPYEPPLKPEITIDTTKHTRAIGSENPKHNTCSRQVLTNLSCANHAGTP